MLKYFVTALTFYGVNKGWAACHNSDIWAKTDPVGDFGKGNPKWAGWNLSLRADIAVDAT